MLAFEAIPRDDDFSFAAKVFLLLLMALVLTTVLAIRTTPQVHREVEIGAFWNWVGNKPGWTRINDPGREAFAESGSRLVAPLGFVFISVAFCWVLCLITRAVFLSLSNRDLAFAIACVIIPHIFLGLMIWLTMFASPATQQRAVEDGVLRREN